MRINRMTSLAVLAASLLLLGCPNYKAVQCIRDENCDLSPGGVCAIASETGHKWCAHPDASCPSGLRYEQDGKYPETGDGLSGVCVAVEPGVEPGVDAGPMVDAVPTAPAATSCIAVPHTCGANNNDDCCASLMVVGGDYFRSFDVGTDGNSEYEMIFPATVSSFYLDKYEVTVGRFRAFVEAALATQSSPPAVGAGTNAHIPGSGWQASWSQYLPANKVAMLTSLKCTNGGVAGGPTTRFDTWTDNAGSGENQPINCVSWYEAMAFCAWDGGYLPTEAEWNYAAAGGNEQRAFPWSSPASSVSVDATRGSYNNLSGCIGDGDPACTLADLLPVGSKPAGDGKWGHSDLFGNVSEWVLDWNTGMANPCTDCANLTPPNTDPLMRVVRGSYFNSDPGGSHTSHRGAYPVNSATSYGVGFRCARAP
jgi:sulfatase modifying factor 1